MHMTAHRSQGQTLSGSVVGADMNLDNPDKATPADIGSVIYVALTRVRRLADLLVSPIFPSTWEKIGKSEMDDRRRKADTDLVMAAEQFAMYNGKLNDHQEEINFKAVFDDVDQEWNDIKSMTAPPGRKLPNEAPIDQCEALQLRFKVKVDGEIIVHPLCLEPSLSERHIGIDQGTKNFAIVCVDKRAHSISRLVAAELYDLHLPKTFNVLDLADTLVEHTHLMNWMQLEGTILLDHVDRVIVHLEQMCVKNGNSRVFTIELGKYLQSRVSNPNTCIVKLSQANVHRKNGPVSKLGEEIVKALSLTPSTYVTKKKDFELKRATDQSAAIDDYACTCKRRISKKCKAKKHLKRDCKQLPVVEHAHMEIDTELQSNLDDDIAMPSEVTRDGDEYTRKKRMSGAIFEYFINASQDQQVQMQIEVDSHVQEGWKLKMLNSSSKPKLDDVGDALLHALNELFCGSTNYRQLVPASSAVTNNRTVVITVLPHMTCWITINCQFNLFVLEDFGVYESSLEGKFFKSTEVEKLIADKLPESLRAALTNFNVNLNFDAVLDIKIVVKQLQGYDMYGLQRRQADALTEAAYNAMKNLADTNSSRDSRVFDKRDKPGHSYMRTDAVSGHNFYVLKSSGKHLNAVLSFLEWVKENANRVLEKRDADLNQNEKLRFFETLEDLAKRDESRLEMMKLSEAAKAKLKSGLIKHNETKKLLADLIWIGLNKNQSHVKAIAANFRAGIEKVVGKKTSAKKSKPKKQTTMPRDKIATCKVVEELFVNCLLVEQSEQQFMSDVEPD